MLAGTPPCIRAARTPLTRRPCARIGTAAGAPEDAGAPEEVVALAEALPCCSRVLSACFEWASEDAMQRRLLSAPTSNTAQYLGAHLGDELLGATSGGPASLLRAACGGHPGVALASVRLLRRRLGWRQLAARQLKVCLTWRGAPTSLSTLNTLGPSMDLPCALALCDEQFAEALVVTCGCEVERKEVLAACKLAQQMHNGVSPWAGSGPVGSQTMP